MGGNSSRKLGIEETTAVEMLRKQDALRSVCSQYSYVKYGESFFRQQLQE